MRLSTARRWSQRPRRIPAADTSSRWGAFWGTSASICCCWMPRGTSIAIASRNCRMRFGFAPVPVAWEHTWARVSTVRYCTNSCEGACHDRLPPAAPHVPEVANRTGACHFQRPRVVGSGCSEPIRCPTKKSGFPLHRFVLVCATLSRCVAQGTVVLLVTRLNTDQSAAWTSKIPCCAGMRTSGVGARCVSVRQRCLERRSQLVQSGLEPDICAIPSALCSARADAMRERRAVA